MSDTQNIPSSAKANETIKAVVRAAEYVRCSDSEIEEEDNSPDMQRESIKSFCNTNSFYLSDKHRYFDAFIGTVYKERRGLQEALLAAKRGEIDVLIVRKYNRLSRDDDQMIIIIKEFAMYGVRVISVMEKVEDSPLGRLALYLIAWQAKQDHDDTVEKFERGRWNIISKGDLLGIGEPAYGWEWNADRSKWIIIPQEACISERIFEMYALEGKGNKAIANVLMGENIIAPNGGKEWYASTIYSMLCNPKYAGIAYQNRYKNVRTPIEGGKFHHKVIERPVSEWVKIKDGLIPAIIDIKLWDLAQERRRMNTGGKTSNVNPEETFLNAADIVHCGYCRRSASIHNCKRAGGNYIPEYRCSNSAVRGRQVCEGVTLKAEPIESAVWENVCQIIRNTSGIEAFLIERWKQLNEKSQQAVQPINDLIRELDEEINNLAIGISTATNSATIVALVARSDKAAEQKQGLESEREIILQANLAVEHEKQLLLEFIAWRENFRKQETNEASNEKKLKVCKYMGVEVFIYRRGHGKKPMKIDITYSSELLNAIATNAS